MLLLLFLGAYRHINYRDPGGSSIKKDHRVIFGSDREQISFLRRTFSKPVMQR